MTRGVLDAVAQEGYNTKINKSQRVGAMSSLDVSFLEEQTRINELPFALQWKIRPLDRKNPRVDQRVCLDGTFAHHWHIVAVEGLPRFDSHCKRCGIEKEFTVSGIETDAAARETKYRQSQSRQANGRWG